MTCRGPRPRSFPRLRKVAYWTALVALSPWIVGRWARREVREHGMPLSAAALVLIGIMVAMPLTTIRGAGRWIAPPPEPIMAGFAVGRKLDKRAVYTDLGITVGMAKGVRDAEKIGQPIEERSLPGWKRDE